MVDLWVIRCDKTLFIEPLYYILVTAAAQIVLTQRFDVLRFEHTRLSLPFQNLCNYGEEQTDREHTVCSRHSTALYRILHPRWSGGDPRYFHLITQTIELQAN